jgi:hypothetical protein
MADKETEGYKRSRQIEREENEADQKAFSLSNLGRKAMKLMSGAKASTKNVPHVGFFGDIDSNGKYTVPPSKEAEQALNARNDASVGTFKKYRPSNYEAIVNEAAREDGKKRGGSIQKYAKGGSVSSASSRADGCAQRGKTKGRMV